MPELSYSSILSGLIGVTLSHPIDTLKTNQQISGNSLLSVIKSMNSRNIVKLTIR